jgi:solute:Na+ symporter, SSS family
VTVYSMVGGIVAVIWADAIQAVVLLLGAVIALGVILYGMPEGPSQVFEMAEKDNKFSLGSYDPWTISQPTVWLLLAYGFFENLKNFGIDQSYIQRYIASRSDAEARRAVWLSAGLYVPVSALFFFIGTSLFAFYQAHPADINEVKRIVARQRLMQTGATTIDEQEITNMAFTLTDRDIGDRVFPHFIAAHLPRGLTGLLIAAIFAAAMSTVSTSLNSSATLVMSDFYKRFISPQANERSLMRILHGSTILWGVLGTGMAMALVRLTESALDIWWTLSSVLGSGIIGLFLLGILCRRAANKTAIISVTVGSLVVFWMVISPTPIWPTALSRLVSPFHSFAVIVVGCTVIVVLGALLSYRGKTREASD